MYQILTFIKIPGSNPSGLKKCPFGDYWEIVDFFGAFRSAGGGAGIGAGADARVPDSVQKPVPHLLFKPYDGSRGVDHSGVAGAVPFERRGQRVFVRLRREGDRLAQIGLLHGGHRAAVSLEEPRLQHDFIYGGAQQHSQGASRGRGGRGRVEGLSVLPHQAALPVADGSVRHDSVHHQLL